MNLINNVKNSTIVFDYLNGNLKATLTADDGYVIDNAYIEYYDDIGMPTHEDFEIEDGGKTAVLSASFVPDEDIEVTGETKAGGGVVVEIINNIKGTTAKGLGDADEYVITLSSNPPKRDKYINTDVTYTGADGSELHSEVTNLGLPWGRGEVTLNNVDLSKPITIDGLFTEAVEIEHNLTNCTTNIKEGYIQQNITIDVVVTADEGTEFKTAPQISYVDGGTPYSKNLEVDGNTATISFVIGNYDSISIWGECVAVEIIGKDYGAINVYKLTDEQISQFAGKRFVTIEGTDPETGGAVYKVIDLGAYVNRIKRLYVDVTDGLSDVIRCGEYNTAIQCVQPKEDRVLLDFGTVTIPHYNGDSVDYDASIKMFLPFVGFTNIDTSYTGRELKLIYDVNVITGFAVGKLYCDDMLVQLFDIEPSTNVIYKVVSENINTIGDNTFDESKYYGLEPFIMIERFESLAPDRNNDSETGKIGDFKGYTRFIDVGLINTPKMLMSEQELIYDALRRGVYVE